MAPLKLYGNVMATCTQRVLLTAAELGQDLELVSIDIMKGEQKSENYLKNIHPWGKVPALADEDLKFTMYESRAIARYLSNVKFPSKGKTLVISPDADPKAYAVFEQAASVEAANLDPALLGLVGQKLFAPMRGLTPDEAKITESRDSLIGSFDIYEKILSERAWLAGDKFTLVDLFHIPMVKLLGACGEMDLIDSRPHVKAWWEKITQRESFKKVLGSH